MLQPALAALRYAFAAAPLPYILSQGPDVVDVVVTPQQLGAETRVTISATADAGRIAPLSGSSIAPISEPIERVRAARLIIDELPWIETPFAFPLAAVDGSFNTVREEVSATIEMACLPNGRHTLYLQAEDDARDWGVVAAEFVTVTNTTPLTATIQSNMGNTKEGQPVTYTAQLTNSNATTTTYIVETSGDINRGADVAVMPSQPITLPPGASLQLTVVVTPKINTAGTTVPTVLIIRSLVDPSQCRQLQMATEVEGWNYNQIFLIIGKN